MFFTSRSTLRPYHNLIVLILSFALAGAAPPATAQQTVSHYGEMGKLMRAPQALGVLGDDLFGDSINYYTGSLSFVQNDVSLPGNSVLPVAVGRRLKTASGYEANGHFGNWDLDIPHLHGIFASAGWTTAAGTDPSKRCSKFTKPRDVVSSQTANGTFLAAEFWSGNFIYVPGHGDQELLRRRPGNRVLPAGFTDYPVVTRNNWQIKCLISGTKEYFLALSPDGTSYQFDWEVSRPATTLSKSHGMPVGSPNSVSTQDSLTEGTSDSPMKAIAGEEISSPEEPPSPTKDPNWLLNRVEVFLFPSVVKDKYGNKVKYTYDATNRWQLKTIHSEDVAVPTNAETSRTLTFTYESPTSRLITAVTDGVRTWQYAYHPTAPRVLTRVTLPDNSAWTLGGMAGFLTSLYYNEGPSCDLPGLTGNGITGGSMVHPSGAVGEFILTPTLHGRTGVPFECPLDIPSSTRTPVYNKLFHTLALTKKTISGPGLPPLVWSASYPDAESSYAPCPAAGCVQSKTVKITSPSGFVTHNKFGIVYQNNEGQVFGSENYDDAGNLLRSTALEYIDAVPPYGESDQPRGDGVVAARVTENSRKTITQQGVTFTKESAEFDPYAKPTLITRTSSLGKRTERIAYFHGKFNWVLGNVVSVTDQETNLVPVLNQLHIGLGIILNTKKFGKLQNTLTYNFDGTVATTKDERGLLTTLTSYKRGIPQNVKYHDMTSESAVVNNIGNIDSVTDPLGHKTTYGYDAIGRLEAITYPTGGPITWLPTTFSFKQSTSTYQDLEAGHWVQTTTTGNALATTRYDAMWRPVYSEQSDTSDAASTMRIVKKQYDASGKVAFESYPKRSYSEISGGKYSTYDALGRVKESRQDSELGLLVTTNEFSTGFVRNTTDARGNTTKTTFQAFDEPTEEAIVSITAPAPLDGIVVNIERDVFGKPKSIKRSGDGKSATRTYVYDGNQRLCKTIEPETASTVQSYDLSDNVSWRATGLALPSTISCDNTGTTVASIKKMSFTYDDRNRLKNTIFGDGSPAIYRTYFADGLLETISSGDSVWTNTYNDRRMHDSETLTYAGKKYSVARTFNPNASLSQIRYPVSGLTVSYDPNALGQPRQVGTYATNVMYHPNGALASFTYGNGIKHTSTQNVRGLPWKSTDTGIIGDEYLYDKSANVGSIKDELKNTTTRTMGYDVLNRLKTVNAPGMWGNAAYEYDALDNLTGTTISAGATARTTVHAIDPVTNRLTSISNGPAKYTFGYLYDAQGNITKRGDQFYGFDQGNRMTSATGRATYVYDGLGHRFSTITNDGVNRIQVYTQAGQLLYTALGAGVGTNYIYLGRHQIAEVKK